MATKNISIITSIFQYPSDFTANNELKLFFTAVFCLISVIFLSYLVTKKPSRKVYLVDFACYKPPSALKCTKKQSLENIMRIGKNYSKEMVDFMENAMHKAGLGDSTYMSEAMVRVPPNPSIETAREEAEMVMFGAIDELLAKTNVACKEIGILIVNCSIFNVVPSLSGMIVNRYKLKENIASYNLTGMGCGAGLIAVGLANNLLEVHHDQYALVVSTENITLCCYEGNDRSKLAPNCVFRLGGAAILLSNRSSDKKSSKYQLMHTIHVNNSSSDISYRSIHQEEDNEGLIGVTITKDLLIAAKSVIESNLTMLGPLILPLSEKIKFFNNLLVRQFYLRKSIVQTALRVRTFPISDSAKVPRYVPKFSKCVDHFYPHVGGKPVLDELQKVLGFDDTIMEAPRMTLYRFGNTSSSSVWYEMAYGEAKGRIKKGDCLWQLAFGSGFTCSSMIWRAMKSIDVEEMNPWREEIGQYPIDWKKIGSLDPKLFFLETSERA